MNNNDKNDFRKVEIISVRFKKNGRSYYFSPKNVVYNVGDRVIVETARGVEYGEVVKANSTADAKTLPAPVKPVIRPATAADKAQNEENLIKAKEALEICAQKIAKHGLDMKLTNAEITFDHNKYIFYFTADGRIDFRELVKDLASVFRARIELRQIGVRDEAKMLNGIGICGRPLCCASFLGDFNPVSIKMAKDQNLSLNPTKISGACGRLMCCLKYEDETYEELNKKLPSVGDIISTAEGTGEILAVSVLNQTVKAAVKKRETDAPTIAFFSVNEIKVLKKKKSKSNKDDVALEKKLEKELND